MKWRRAGVVLALATLLLGVFWRLVAEPSSLIVDADHPSVDHARPRDDPAFGNDLTRLFLPHHLAIARSLAKLGRVPLWDDRGFGGRPLVGNPQAGLFYPPVWIAWWTGSPASLGWITLAHLLGSGLGTYRLGRTLGMSEWGSFVAAGCVQISPYVMSQTFEGHYPHVWAACWYPWAFRAVLKLRRGDFVEGSMLAPILAATFLTGHPQEGYYLAIVLGFWMAFDLLTSVRSKRGLDAFRRGLLAVGLLILALGLTGVELIPDALAQGWTLKGTRLTVRMASRYHASPLNLLQLLSPNALGGPADFFGHENYWESVVSIGQIPFFLAIVGAAWSSDRRAARGWLILVVGSLLFAFGRKFGLFPILFQVVPGMDRFRVPARSLFLASLGASMLAGMGADVLRKLPEKNSDWLRLDRRTMIASLTLAVVVLAAQWRSSSVSTEVDDLQRLGQSLGRLASDRVFWLTLGTVPICLAVGSKFPRSKGSLVLVLSLAGLLEIGYHVQRLIVTTPAARYLDPDPISQAIAGSRSSGTVPTRIRAVDSLYDDFRAEQLGLEKTNVNDSFQIQHAADLYETLYRLFDADLFLGDAPMDQAVGDYQARIRQSVLDRMGVEFLVDDKLDPKAPWPRIASGHWNGSTYVVYRNPTALPRAYVVPRVELAENDSQVVDRFVRVNPREAVFMPFDPLATVPGDRQRFRAADWVSADPDRRVIRIETEAPGLLVIGETWMPGWSAEVDGYPLPVLRGNRAQQVVPLVEAGRHEVVLSYRTPGLTAGVALTIASAVVWLTAVLAVRIGFNRRSAAGSDREPQPRR